MKKYTKIRRLGHERNQGILQRGNLILKEKLDGANFRFTVTEEGEILCGSKNVEYQDESDVDGRFRDAIKCVKQKFEEAEENSFYYPRYTFFAENMVKHSLDYPFEEMPQIIGFDVYDHEENCYLSHTEAYEMFNSLGIKTAPIVDSFDAEEFDPEEYEVPESNFRDGKMEGVVIINQDLHEDQRSGFSTRAKTVTDEFAEKHKKATGARQSKEAIHGHEKVVSKYCTDGRIRKHIGKMKDEGRDLGMELMANQDGSAGLPIRVSTDILEEEADEIVKRNDKINWKEYRSLVADKCVYVLRQEITKNAS